MQRRADTTSRGRVNEAINPARKAFLFPRKEEERQENEKAKEKKRRRRKEERGRGKIRETGEPDIRSVLESDSTRRNMAAAVPREPCRFYLVELCLY